MIYPYSGILFVHTKNEVLMSTCYNMDEFRKHPAEWKKPDTYCMIPFKGNVQNTPVHRDESRLLDVRGWVEGRMGSDF